MKRIIAFALVLVLVLSLVATAFASYYPSVKFTSSSKNKSVKYGKTLKLKWKCNSGSGPFNLVYDVYGDPIWRSNFDVYFKKGSRKLYVESWFWSGKVNITGKYKTKYYFTRGNRRTKFQVQAVVYYRPTYGYTVYGWEKYKTVKTNFYINP